MRQALRVNTWPGSALVAAMVLLTLGIGFCLFDGDDHSAADDGVSFDLCIGLAVVSVSVVLLVFVLAHTLAIDPPYVLHVVPLHRPDPPPKAASLS